MADLVEDTINEAITTGDSSMDLGTAICFFPLAIIILYGFFFFLTKMGKHVAVAYIREGKKLWDEATGKKE
ncbi:MAG: hypothetical protein ACOYWZ_00115 [Bacillota bacterium]